MIRIYTPAAWEQFFRGAPSLVIDGNYIYHGDTYENLVRTPIGAIKNGYLYGEDYWHFDPVPIGKIVEDTGGVVRIYGKNYADTGIAPLYYVKDGKVYTPQEYNRFLGGNPSAYVRQDPPPRPATGGVSKSTNDTNDTETEKIEPKPEESFSFGPVGQALLVIGTLILTFVGFVTGYYGVDLTITFAICCAVSTLLAVLIVKENSPLAVFIYAEIIVAVGMFIVAAVSDLILGNFPWSLYKIFIAVVGSFFAAVFCSGMNFVLSLVIWGIRKLLHR